MRIAQKLEAYVETWEGRDVQNPRSPNYKENKLKKKLAFKKLSQGTERFELKCLIT